MNRVNVLVAIQAVTFAIASMIHAGVLVQGYEHRQASIAEGVIAGVLAVGWLTSAVRPDYSRAALLAVQGFALLGTCVGITMIAIGVGPQSRFDVALHAGFVALLLTGLVLAGRRTAIAA
jgi:energy-converting hydrogenase Eha subunit B